MQVEYKINFGEVLKRYQALWAGQMQDQIMARIHVRENSAQSNAYMANVPDIHQMFEDYLQYWRTSAKLQDDTLPVIAPNFGTGIEGGFFGADVTFTASTSWSDHPSDIIDYPERVKYDSASKYIDLIRECTKHFLENNNGKCVVGPANIDGPGDILYMLRGTAIYTDMIDNPKETHSLLATIAEGIKQFRKEMWEMVPLYQGGTFNGWMNWWVPNRTGMIGADLFCSCSPDTYSHFGLPIHQQLADSYGTAWFHLHNLGLHLVPQIVKIPNLICLEIAEDPNVAIRGLEMLKQVKTQIPAELVVKATIHSQEFLEALDAGTLPGNTIYDVCEENYQDIVDWDINYANALMEKVKQYRARQ